MTSKATNLSWHGGVENIKELADLTGDAMSQQNRLWYSLLHLPRVHFYHLQASSRFKQRATCNISGFFIDLVSNDLLDDIAMLSVHHLKSTWARNAFNSASIPASICASHALSRVNC